MELTIARHQQAYLQFVQGYKANVVPALSTAMTDGIDAPDWRTAQAAIAQREAWRHYGFVQRSSQHMMWTGLLDIIDSRAGDIDRLLSAPAERGSLTLDPGLELPAYFRESDIHLRPLDLWQRRGQGFVSGIANQVYFGGRNDQLQGQRWAVAQLPALPPRARVLDLGCGVGQSTWPLAERYPDAELHALDLPADLCTYTWQEAQHRGLDLHVRQAAAEATGYDDESFDLVFAFILFHEVPDAAAATIIAEVRRILKPGGVFGLCDVRPYRLMPPVKAATMDWQVEGNGEAFWRDHGLRDYQALFAEAGYAHVDEVLSPDTRSMTMVYLAHG